MAAPVSIFHARYYGKVSTATRFTQVIISTGASTTSSWVNASGVVIHATSIYGRWYEAQYERSREQTAPVGDPSRVCYNAGSSSYNSAASTTYEIRWTLGNPLIACTVEYATRTRNGTTGAFTYSSFSSVVLDATTPEQILTIPLPSAANDSNAFIYRFCFRPFMSHTT